MNCVLILVTNLVLSVLVPAVSHTCIHHKVSHEVVPVVKMVPKDSRVKRHLFLPLHIHVHMDEMDHNVHEDIRHSIDDALKKAVKFFQETIEVKQNFFPFLLERLNCARKWQSGVNKEKCSRLKSGPEFCSTKLTDYVIPDTYLSKLEVYNYTDNIPHQVLKEGQGLQEANFILFVISRSTSWCAESDVQAYGSYCRLDNENRPVAGLLNLCPSKFSKKLLKNSHYFNVIMHELIHILGFSHHLYPKFKTCHSAYDCEIPKKIVHTDAHNIQRLVFPEVINSMQAHFNCSESEFGAPLEPHEGRGSSLNKYTSHWHPLLMYTSIMTPSVSEDSYVVIDNITLALLYSTGWYKVDFEKAQKFQFGKGSGCNFGFGDTCENYNHERFLSGNASNCDILEHVIGKCESIVPYHPCVVHKTKDEERYLDDNKKYSVLDVRLVEYKHTCDTVRNENNMTEPVCLVTKCQNTKSAKALENASLNTSLSGKVQGNAVNCSNNFSFCYSKECICKYDSSLGGWKYLDKCLFSNSNSEDFEGIIETGSREDPEVILRPEVEMPLNVNDGFHISFIVLAVCGIIVIAVSIPFILRFASRRHQIPESATLKDLNQSAI